MHPMNDPSDLNVQGIVKHLQGMRLEIDFIEHEVLKHLQAKTEECQAKDAHISALEREVQALRAENAALRAGPVH